MKSAYELAMERLRTEQPDKELTAEQKERLAEIDNKYAAKLAEREVFLKPKMAEAQVKGDAEAIRQLEKQLRDEKAMLEDDKEREKAKVRG